MTGHRLLVLGTFGDGGIHQYLDEQVSRLPAEISVSTYDMTTTAGNGTVHAIRALLAGLLAIARFPARSAPDLVHIHTSHRFSFYRASFYALYAKQVWNVPVVLHVHGSAFDDFVATDSQAVAALQRAVFDAAAEIIVLSEYWRDIVGLRADESKIRVVPNAVDPEDYPVDPEVDRPEEANEAHVVFVSNLIERKGVSELVAALDRLADRRDDFRATVAGDGPLADRVEALADDHEAVEYVGYVSEERKRTLLAEGSVFVLPTYAEGLPIAMLEGMAGANAVVSTSVGSIPEVIDDDRGLLVEPGDVDGLVDAMETLLNDPRRRERMAASNRRAVETEYSWDSALAELRDAYESCLRT